MRDVTTVKKVTTELLTAALDAPTDAHLDADGRGLLVINSPVRDNPLQLVRVDLDDRTLIRRRPSHRMGGHG